jgi:GH35 family endo-1,4-beta-xylanase
MKNAMSNILEKVISQYSDIAIGMDVCNEILNDQGNLDDQNPWLPKLGDNWVHGAFEAAKSIRDKYNKDMLLFSKPHFLDS